MVSGSTSEEWQAAAAVGGQKAGIDEREWPVEGRTNQKKLLDENDKQNQWLRRE